MSPSLPRDGGWPPPGWSRAYAAFGTQELADGVLAALEDRRAALLSGHGAVVHAAGVGEAIELTALLEWACTVFRRAAAIGTPRTLGEAEVAQAREGLDWTRRVSS